MKKTIFLITILFCLISYAKAEKLKVTNYLVGTDSCSYYPRDLVIDQNGNFITVGDRKHNYSNITNGFINIVSKVGVVKSIYLDKYSGKAIHTQLNHDTIVCDFINSRSDNILFDTLRRVYFDRNLRIIKEDTSINNKTGGLFKFLTEKNGILVFLAYDNLQWFISYFDSKLKNIKLTELKGDDSLDAPFYFLNLLDEGIAFRGGSHFYLADLQGNIIKKGVLDITPLSLNRLKTGNYLLAGIDFNSKNPILKEYDSNFYENNNLKLNTRTNDFEIREFSDYFILAGARPRSLDNPIVDRVLIYLDKATGKYEETILEFHTTKMGVYTAGYFGLVNDNLDLFAYGVSGDSLVFSKIEINTSTVNDKFQIQLLGVIYNQNSSMLTVSNNSEVTKSVNLKLFSLTGDLIQNYLNIQMNPFETISLNIELMPGVYLIQSETNFGENLLSKIYSIK